jgi:hypothetical protein
MKRRKVQDKKGIEGLRIQGSGEGRTGETLIGRTKPFARKAKATKVKGRMLRHVADGSSRSRADWLSRCGSSRPAMTTRATVTIKAAYADGLRSERHSQETWCGSSCPNRRLADCERSFGCAAGAEVTTWSQVRGPDRQAIDGTTLRGQSSCCMLVGDWPGR